MLDPYILIGVATRPHGNAGELRVKPVTCDVERFRGLKRVWLLIGGEYRERAVRVFGIAEREVHISVEGVGDREAAEKLRGAALYVTRAEAVELPEDAEFICDLIGVRAEDEAGREIGTLTEVLQPGACDVYVFEGPAGKLMAPALKSLIRSVDVESKRMIVDSKRLREVAVLED